MSASLDRKDHLYGVQMNLNAVNILRAIRFVLPQGGAVSVSYGLLTAYPDPGQTDSQFF